DLELAEPPSGDAGAGNDDARPQREPQWQGVRAGPAVEGVLLDSDAYDDSLGAHAGRPPGDELQLLGVDVDDGEVQPRDPEIGDGHAGPLRSPGGQARRDRHTHAYRGTD